METAPWSLLYPASFLAVTLFAFNFLGDGLRDALDPKDQAVTVEDRGFRIQGSGFRDAVPTRTYHGILSDP